MRAISCLMLAIVLASAEDKAKRSVEVIPSSYLGSNVHVHTVETVTKRVPVAVPYPQPYQVTVTKHVPVPQPYTVEIRKNVPYPVHVHVPVEVPRPYRVNVPQPYPVHVPVHVPVEVPKPYTVTVTKTVEVPVEKPIYVKVPVPVPQPQPVPVPQPQPVVVPQPQPSPVPQVVSQSVNPQVVSQTLFPVTLSQPVVVDTPVVYNNVPSYVKSSQEHSSHSASNYESLGSQVVGLSQPNNYQKSSQEVSYKSSSSHESSNGGVPVVSTVTVQQPYPEFVVGQEDSLGAPVNVDVSASQSQTDNEINSEPVNGYLPPENSANSPSPQSSVNSPSPSVASFTSNERPPQGTIRGFELVNHQNKIKTTFKY